MLLQFIQDPLAKEVGFALRKRLRSFGTTNHFIHLGTQLWKKDWHTYGKPRIRVNTWAKIQLDVFSSARVGEYIESSCRAGSGRGLYYSVSMLFEMRWLWNHEYHELRSSSIEYDLRSLSKRTRKSRVRYTSRARCKVHDTNAGEKVSHKQFTRPESHAFILMTDSKWTGQNTPCTRAYSLDHLCAIQCSHCSPEPSQTVHLETTVLWKNFLPSNLRTTRCIASTRVTEFMANLFSKRYPPGRWKRSAHSASVWKH